MTKKQRGEPLVLPLRVFAHILPYHRVLPRDAPGVDAIAVRPPCFEAVSWDRTPRLPALLIGQVRRPIPRGKNRPLAAGDALGSERERHFGSLAGADSHVLSLNRDLAVLSDFGPQRVAILAADFEGRSDKRAPSGGGASDIAVD